VDTASSGESSSSSTTDDGPPPPPGEVQVLTYNVAGLPQGISGSNPEVNMPQISPLLNDFDLVLVQEDFWYHDELVAEVTLPYASMPWSARPSLEDIGDGLNRFGIHPFADHERVAWYACHGQLDCASDCLATKGWSFARTTLAPGVELDVYNLHMEAGGCPEDIEIRTNAAQDLVDAIAARSEGRAVLVAGDFNLDAEDPEDVEPLAIIVDGAGLTDACDAVACGDQRIDHVMVRSSDALELEVLSWSIPEQFVDAATGEPLSDHLPVAAELRATPR
ncbi:MAG: endonuclease/exonuclease/phosphatase family protein, partial [Myxococcales bacterium]|nr:endonuclease/exonuclease/phosphatase family protein [Myxococcales bacterium]